MAPFHECGDPSHHPCSSPLHDPGVGDGERGRSEPEDRDDGHHGRRDGERPVGLGVGAEGDVVQVPDRTGGEHHQGVHRDEDDHPDQHAEVDRPGDLTVERAVAGAELRRDRRCLEQAGDEREWGGHEHREEVGEDLQPVVRGESSVDGELERQVLHRCGRGVREHSERAGDQPFPLAGAEQQDEEDGAVDQPEEVEAEVPPPRESDRMPEPR